METTAIQPFAFEGHPVSIIVEEETPLFLAADVLSLCGIGNVTDAMGRLDDDEKTKRSPPTSIPSKKGPPVPACWYVTEAGLYSLVNGSRTEESKRFRRWVNHEVLPAIRRTGSYSAAPESEDALVLRAFGVLQNRVKALEAKVAEDAPKVAGWHALMDAEGLFSIMDAGKAMGVQPRLFFDWMISTGNVFKRGGNVLARQDHIQFARMRQVTVVVGPEGKGRIYAKLTAHGLTYFTERIEQFRAAATRQHRRLPAALVPALPEAQP